MFLLLLTTIFIGCSAKQKDNQHIQRPRMNQNLTEEERQQFLQERQQKAIEACDGKDEGENCIFESPMGEMEGICKMMDNNLFCTLERPMGTRE